MTVRVDNAAPAAYDLAQIRVLAQARFGAALMDCNTVTAADGSTLIAVYLPAAPNGAKASAWANDLAAYTVSHPTADDMAANLGTLQSRAQNALIANATFLAIASPTNAQNAAQVQALTKECSALIRLILGQFDSTSGT